MRNDLVIVRGAGDLATGTIHRLTRCGFFVLALEIEKPTVIRRTVSFAQAVFDGGTTVEDVTAVRADSESAIWEALEAGRVPIAVDPKGKRIADLKPAAVIDAILAKKNLGTVRSMASVVIGLGPGFTAGTDVDAVIETNRGHNLGRVILEGPAEANTGIPGVIAGFGAERVIRSPGSGVIRTVRDICDLVKKGETVATVGDFSVKAPLDGVLRGMIADGAHVTAGFKIGDVDPRGVREYCFGISDKARAIAGGVVEALLYLSNHLPDKAAFAPKAEHAHG